MQKVAGSSPAIRFSLTRTEPYLAGGQLRSIDMELLLSVLLALMIPGLLTYLVPERGTETARD